MFAMAVFATISIQAKDIVVNTPNTSLLLKAEEGQPLHVSYYGERIDNISQVYSAYSLWEQAYPAFGAGGNSMPALNVKHADGNMSTELVYHSDKQQNEPNATVYTITMKDRAYDFWVDVCYRAYTNSDVIETWTVIRNNEKKPVRLLKYASGFVPLRQSDAWVSHQHGTWGAEAYIYEEPLQAGVFEVNEMSGTKNAVYNRPNIMISLDGKPRENEGRTIGAVLCWAGPYRITIDTHDQKEHQLIAGINETNAEYTLNRGESFTTPELALAYSDGGMGGVSRSYHRWARLNNKVYNGTALRKILLNSWEGVYLNVSQEGMEKMMDGVQTLGGELFVMDDGWFGKRDLDVSGLGDWTVNVKKLGCTLKELSDQIHGLGLQFGIWFEPEGINEDSDLYRAHPDWAFTIPGKQPTRSRLQLLLDFSREDVREYIFSHICQVLDSARIEYLKWDLNRSLADLYSASLPAKRQGEVMHRYVLGLYDMLEKLTQRYPDMLIEGCSGGGGRFDAGMLYYTPQIWCSDDTDAIERLSIQYGTSFGYPVSTMGSHVSHCPNEQTRRITPLNTRATVAMSGTFGYELDVNKMTEEEKTIVKAQIREFKEYYDLIQYGDYYRLTDPNKVEAYHGWEFAAPDGSEALLCIVALQIHPNGPGRWMCLKGLKADSVYLVHGQKYPGDALMNGGLLLPTATEEYESFRIHIVECPAV